MSSLVVLAIIAFVILNKAGPVKRADWKRQIERAVQPELDKIREHPSMPERFRKPTPPPPPAILGRTATPPPPIGRPVEMPRSASAPPPPSTGAPEHRPSQETPQPTGAAAPETEPPPEAEPDPAPSVEPTTTEPSEPAVEPEPASEPGDLSLDATIAALFDRSTPPHDRAELFDAGYAGEPVEWTVTAVRASRGRRHREPATRAELLLGYSSDRRLFSDRIVAEAYFPVDVTLERDQPLTVRAILTEVNVYANRLVLDHAEVVEPGS